MKEILEKTQYINWKELLLSNYRNLNLKEEEVLIVFMIDYYLSQNETVITPELLSLKMTYDQQTIDKYLSNLFNKGLVTLEDDEEGKLKTSLNGLKYILISDFLKVQNKPKNDEEIKKEENIFEIFESQFGRPLSFVELETMKKWFEEKYEEDKILLALKEAVACKKKNIRYIDKILLEWRQQEERKQEGYTTITDTWHKDIKETIEIANRTWVNKDENK